LQRQINAADQIGQQYNAASEHSQNEERSITIVGSNLPSEFAHATLDSGFVNQYSHAHAHQM
jgi:hypothetical protein